MDRRSFLATLVGGLAAASFGTAALAAPQPKSAIEPRQPDETPQVEAEALDKTEADYARYHHRRRYHYHRRRRHWRRHYWRRRYYRPRYYHRRHWRPHRRYYYRRRYW